ncbi:MAG: hypothetical protein FVQ80_18545 [Planctomycetes bacterium]|nr:hypothetical protein [Planctomycetota bacterium]
MVKIILRKLRADAPQCFSHESELGTQIVIAFHPHLGLPVIRLNKQIRKYLGLVLINIGQAVSVGKTRLGVLLGNEGEILPDHIQSPVVAVFGSRGVEGGPFLIIKKPGPIHQIID